MTEIKADVSCEQVATKTLRAAFTWGGMAALFVVATLTELAA